MTLEHVNARTCPCTQELLDAIADELNHRLCVVHNFVPSLAVFRAMIESLELPDSDKH